MTKKLSGGQIGILDRLAGGVTMRKVSTPRGWLWYSSDQRDSRDGTVSSLIERKLIALHQEIIAGRRVFVATLTPAGRAALAQAQEGKNK